MPVRCGRDGLAAGSSAPRAAGVEVRNHFPGRPELLDYQEASRFLHQDALALVMHVAGSDDKTDRDAANELVLVDRERDKFLTSGVRALADKPDDHGVFAPLSAPLVDLPAQRLTQRGLPLALLLFPICSTDLQLLRAGEIRSGESSLHDRAGRTAEHAQIVGAPRESTPPTDLEQAAAAGSLSLRTRCECAARRGQHHACAAGQLSTNFKVGLKRAFLAVLRRSVRWDG